MKKLAIAALIICVASLSLYVREAFIIESDPYYLHHFTGKTKQQAEITVKDFRIVNPAPEDIKLISMTKNCSCIDLQLTMPGIKRNETATCRMTWNTGGVCWKNFRCFQAHFQRGIHGERIRLRF